MDWQGDSFFGGGWDDGDFVTPIRPPVASRPVAAPPVSMGAAGIGTADPPIAQPEPAPEDAGVAESEEAGEL
jgi:hypothetical protein